MNIGSMLSLSLKQKLSQSQILFLQLLPMTNQELDQFLEKEYMENPLLERDETAVMSFKIDYSDKNQSRSNNRNDSETYDILMNMPQPTAIDINSFFTEQLDKKEFSDNEWKIIHFCIDNLDENGYIDKKILHSCISDNISMQQIDSILSKLKELEPAGCFAQDLSECLLIQLRRKNNIDEKLEVIVREYLSDLLNQRISYISKELKIPSQRIRKYIAQIAELDPKPLSGFNAGTTVFVIPDIICSKENGSWKIGLNTGIFDGYCLSDYYCSIMQTTENEELKSYLKSKMNRVKMVMDNIEQRRNMIIKLTRLIIEVQNDFFEGRGKIQPFTMASAAEILEVSPSTITRTVKNKWIQYPGGTVPMKTLFTTSASNYTECSADHIKEMLTDFVKKEDPYEPYSDFQLVEMLEKNGVKISRRTVAKYRSELGIQSCYSRKRYA